MMTQAEGAGAAERLLDGGGQRPEAVLFANDQMAVGALRALARRGVRVPEDMAVTGFDGIPLSRIVQPPLTTVRQPIRQLGEQAVELLVQRLNNAGREPVSLTLPVSPIRRRSCGCG